MNRFQIFETGDEVKEWRNPGTGSVQRLFDLHISVARFFVVIVICFVVP